MSEIFLVFDFSLKSGGPLIFDVKNFSAESFVPMFLKIIIASVCFFSGRAFALPEIARYGQLTCVGCHTSPGGGGLLTPYGRDFASEKLSTWSRDGEAEILHGIVRSPEFLLAGGDARWVQYQTKTNDKTFKKFWRMQTDLELGVHVGSVYLTQTFGTKPAGPMDQFKNGDRLVHRGYMGRVDFLDERLVVRAGLFMPKYGLMMSDHTAFVRVLPGLRPDGEQTQLEMSYQDDDGDLEVTVAGLLQNDMYDRKDKSKSGFNLGLNLLLAGKNRLGFGFLTTNQKQGTVDTVMNSLGASGVLTASNEVFAMFELARVHNQRKMPGTVTHKESLASFMSLNLEIYRGVIPYLRYEFLDTDTTLPDTSHSRWAGGLMWYPRPHFQFEGRVGKMVSDMTHATTSESEVIMHYYF